MLKVIKTGLHVYVFGRVNDSYLPKVLQLAQEIILAGACDMVAIAEEESLGAMLTIKVQLKCLFYHSQAELLVTLCM